MKKGFLIPKTISDCEEAKATLALPLFLLAVKKKAIIVSFGQDSSVLTAARTADLVIARERLLRKIIHWVGFSREARWPHG